MQARAFSSRVCPSGTHTAPSPVLRHTPVLRTSAPQLQRRVMCKAASEDPYEVLGIKRDANDMEIARAYNKKKYEGRGNPAMLQKVEAAHGKLMMAAFHARVKGKNVDHSIRYADREQLFPWKPKRWDATPKVIMIFGAAQLTVIAFTFQAPNISKLVMGMLVGIAGNVMKQNAISPPPSDPNTATEEEAGRAGRNFVRGALLGLMATFTGVLVGSAPEYLSRVVPRLALDPALLVCLKVAASCVFNWIITSYYY